MDFFNVWYLIRRQVLLLWCTLSNARPYSWYYARYTAQRGFLCATMRKVILMSFMRIIKPEILYFIRRIFLWNDI